MCDNSSEKNNCLPFSKKKHQYKNENLQNSSNARIPRQMLDSQKLYLGCLDFPKVTKAIFGLFRFS